MARPHTLPGAPSSRGRVHARSSACFTLPEAGRRLGSQRRKRIVAERGQLKRKGAFLLLSCATAPLREALVRGDPRETTWLSDVVRAWLGLGLGLG